MQQMLMVPVELKFELTVVNFIRGVIPQLLPSFGVMCVTHYLDNLYSKLPAVNHNIIY